VTYLLVTPEGLVPLRSMIPPFYMELEVDSKKKDHPRGMVFARDSGGIQTPNLLIRSQMHYSVMLRSLIAGAKVDIFLNLSSIKQKNPPNYRRILYFF
jgi:hypothetical protein